MKIKLMTWNTQLYEYGNIIATNKPVRSIDYTRCNEVLKVIKEHIDKKENAKENAIAVLQEIPLRSNITNSEHIIFTLLCGAFPEKDYTVIYNVNETIRNQIKMTVVISKKNFIRKDEEGINRSNEDYCNCFVSFMVDNVKVLAVHQSLKKGGFVNDKIISGYTPDIILGDFNAGNYKKREESNEFKNNRQKYITLLNNGYTDICQGQNTTKYGTPIDHVLIKSNIKYEANFKIDEKNNNSDHYPIYCEIEILTQ